MVHRLSHYNNIGGELPSDDGSADWIYAEFGRRLQAQLIQRNWTQSDLGRQMGIQRDRVSHWIRGKHLPKPADLEHLANTLGCTPGDLVSTRHLPRTKLKTIDWEMDDPVVAGSKTHGMLRVNLRVSMRVATEVIQMLLPFDKLAA